ncbi:hypothetical protein GB937_004820 [Aspergillus fischeri]|nr:hypothetical protein GB937_004820 [Aspergillus fischeri]
MNWLEQEDTYFPEQYLHSRSCLSFVGMNRDKQSKPSPDRLPKSVKVRSTCNACQQAKIRCSHEKPSCRRCLKHNIECIYSMSRRLGRPAKRRESQYAGLPPDTQRVDARRHERDKKAPISKKKAKEGQANNKKDDEDDFPQRLGETVAYNTIAVDQTMLDDISLDDTNLSTPTFGERDQLPSFAVNDAVDFSSDSWLQEFLSQQGPELAQESDLFDALALENPKNDMPMAVSKQGYNDSESSLKSFPTSSPVGEDHPPTVSLYFADDPMPTEAVTSSAQCPATIQDSYSEFLRRGASVKPQQFSIAEALSGKSWTATEQANLRAHSRAWKRANDVDSPKNNLSPSLAPVSTATGRQCQSEQSLLLFEAICAAYSINRQNTLFDPAILAFEQQLPPFICVRSAVLLGQTELNEEESVLLVRILLSRNLMRLLGLLEGLRDVMRARPKDTVHTYRTGTVSSRSWDTSIESIIHRLVIFMEQFQLQFTETTWLSTLREGSAVPYFEMGARGRFICL